MRKFEQFGTRLTRNEAKEIRGGQDNIENPVTDPTDPGGGGGSGACPTNPAGCHGQECIANLPIIGLRRGTCQFMDFGGGREYCVCSVS